MSETHSTFPCEPGVTYKQIASFPDFYLIGTDGSVWTCRVRGSKFGRKGKWWRMKTPLSSGYPVVNLARDGKQGVHFVHHLVLETFVGPCPEGMECRHLNGRPAESRLDNLAWGTPIENANDKRSHGTHQFGSKHGRAVLTESQVLVIKTRLKAGEDKKLIARDYGVTDGNIRAIEVGRSWWWLDGIPQTRKYRPKTQVSSVKSQELAPNPCSSPGSAESGASSDC